MTRTSKTKASMPAESVSVLRIKTTWGTIETRIARGHITGCDLPVVADEMKQPLRVLSVSKHVGHPGDRAALMAAEKFIRAILVGKKAATPAIRFPVGSPVQIEVWRFLSRLKTGEMVTYGELAQKIKRPKAARAVGQACGANPIPLFIPCHRVLAANGAWGGFSGGLAWKKLLLAR